MIKKLTLFIISIFDFFYQKKIINFLKKKNFIIDIRSEPWGQKVDSEQNILTIGREYRDANLMIDSGDPLITNLARNAAQGSKNIIDLSQNLYRFARKYIQHKNFNVGFAETII